MRRPDVDELLEELGPERFEDWMHFHKTHPLGDDKDRKILARGLWAVFKACGGGDLDEDWFAIEDLKEEASCQVQSIEQQIHIAQQYAGIQINNAGR